jgi:hypothetical protein
MIIEMILKTICETRTERVYQEISGRLSSKHLNMMFSIGFQISRLTRSNGDQECNFNR